MSGLTRKRGGFLEAEMSEVDVMDFEVDLR